MAKKRKGTSAAEWMEEPEEHDYAAAADYLSLLFSESEAAAIVKKLGGAAVLHRRAKDLLRASRLELLPGDDPEVAKDLAKVAGGKPLSPVLLVRGRGALGEALIVADGYHRICASYHLDEAADVPCRMVDSG